MSLQRVVGVFERGNGARRQVMQLDARAVAAQRAARCQHVQRERLRATCVVGVEFTPAGLVVDDDELAVAVVDAVDAALGDDRPDRRGDPALEAHGLRGVGARPLDVLDDVVAHPLPGAGAVVGGLRVVAEALGGPVPVDQRRGTVTGPT